MRGCDGGDRNHDDEARDERGPQGEFGDGWECFAEAVEEEAEDVGELVGEEGVPAFDDTMGRREMLVSNICFVYRTTMYFLSL